jgi:hypothetical protein
MSATHTTFKLYDTEANAVSNNEEIEMQSYQVYQPSEDEAKMIITDSRFPSTMTLVVEDEGDVKGKFPNQISDHDKKIHSSNGDLEAEVEQSKQEPSHGRLLPLPSFLLVYACLSLAVLLTSLDQTVGK